MEKTAVKNNQCLSPVSIDDVWQVAIRRLSRLRTQMKLRMDVSRGLAELNVLLESLPLSTSEFGLARNRVNNARRYITAAEWGAAQYEFKLLESNLRSWAEVLTATYHPKRGIRTRGPASHRFGA